MKNRAIEKNIGLTFDFIRDIIAHPGKINEIPDQSDIEFIERDFDENQIQNSENKILVKVKHTFEVIKNPK